MVLLKYPSLELVERRVARMLPPCRISPASFREYPALLAAWGTARKSPICCLWIRHGISRIRVGLASPVMDCYGRQPSVWRKNGCAVNLNHFSAETRALSPLMIKASKSCGYMGSKARCNRCLSRRGTGSVLTALAWVQLYERVSPAGADALGGCCRFRASAFVRWQEIQR